LIYFQYEQVWFESSLLQSRTSLLGFEVGLICAHDAQAPVATSTSVSKDKNVPLLPARILLE